MARELRPERIAAGTTMLLEARDVQLLNAETGEYADLTTPDATLARIKNTGTGTIIEVTGNQEGTTNNVNAAYTFPSEGEYTWQFVITEGSNYHYTLPQRVSVVASIADVP